MKVYSVTVLLAMDSGYYAVVHTRGFRLCGGGFTSRADAINWAMGEV